MGRFDSLRVRRVVATALALMVVLGAAIAAGDEGFAGEMQGTHAHSPRQHPITLDRIAVLVLENRSWGQIVGNPQAPYLNSMARRGALETHYYAITHPSLPNYLALTTGGHKRVNRDCTVCRSSGRSLANQFEAAHIPWRAYFEDI